MARERQPHSVPDSPNSAWVADLREQRGRILNPDLFAAIATAPLVNFQSTTDPDRMSADLLRIADLLEPQRRVITWTTAQPATNLATGKPIARLHTEQRVRQVTDPKTGQQLDAPETHVTRHPITTQEELFDFILRHPNPAIFFLPNAQQQFENPGEKRLLVDFYAALSAQLRDQHKTVVLQSPHGAQMPPELASLMVTVGEKPVTRPEQELVLRRMMADTGLTANDADFRRVLDSMSGLPLIQAEAALAFALAQMYAIDDRLALNVGRFKREQMAAQNYWTPKEVGNPAPLVGWDRFEREIDQNVAYGSFDSGSPHNVQSYLLVGQAGTGKTSAALLIGKALKRSVYFANVDQWMGSLMGQTEQRMKAAVESIYSQGPPCIAVMDEAQRLLQSNDQKTGGGTMNRSVGALLSRMEQGRQNGEQVLWYLTANEKDGLSPEFLRRTRVWSVPFPGPKTRVGIFRATAERFGASDRKLRIANNLTDGDIAEITRGYAGGDIQQLLSRAAISGGGLVSADSLSAAQEFIPRQQAINPEVIAKRRAEQDQYPSVSSEPEDVYEGGHDGRSYAMGGSMYSAPKASRMNPVDTSNVRGGGSTSTDSKDFKVTVE